MPMPLLPTLLILSASILLAAWSWWQDRKPYEAGSPPLIPRGMIMYISVIVAVLMLAHLVGLLSGNQFAGRGL